MASSILHPGSRVSDFLTTTIVPEVGLGGVGTNTFRRGVLKFFPYR
jgi:hypothetical protein